MYKFARIFSNVFSPLLVPFYGVAIALATSFLSLASVKVKIGVSAATFIITCLIPAIIIWLMWRLGKLSDPGLNNRTERTVPYLITVMSYIACGVYLWNVNAPIWLIMFMAGGVLAVVIDIIINQWWKISAHMTAMGGMLGLACRIAIGEGIAIVNMVWWVALVAILVGAVATSRLLLQRHTPGQVAAGTAVGFLSVLLMTSF